MADIVPSAAGASLAMLRARGADRFDPVRFRFIEALSRRAGDHDGAARRVLDDKLERLIAAYTDDLNRVPAVAPYPIDADPQPGPLAALVARLSNRAPAPSEGRATPVSGVPAAASPVASEALLFLRQTWARLSVEQRLAQSLSAVPGNAGPLNSQHLVHRALTLMREVSPAYLAHFVAYTDALLWIEEANNGVVVKEAAGSPRAMAAERKAPRGR